MGEKYAIACALLVIAGIYFALNYRSELSECVDYATQVFELGTPGDTHEENTASAIVFCVAKGRK